MTAEVKYIANPLIVLREEFDDWAVLFDPDTGHAHGLDPTGVFIWKKLDGKHSIDDILKNIKESCEEVPEQAPAEVQAFLDDLLEKGYISNA